MPAGRSSEGSAGRRASLIDKLKQTYRTNTADDSLGRRASFIDRLKDIKNGVFRRASTSNALPTDIEFDPAATRRFSVITQDEYERKLHTTTAHLDFRSFDWTEELNVEANKNDKRNEPNLSRPSSAGETRKTLLKEVPIFAGHSDTELDDADLTLDLSSLGVPGQ